MNSNQKRIILIEMILIGFLLITYITGTIQFEIVVIVTVIYLIFFKSFIELSADEIVCGMSEALMSSMNSDL